jgi:CheY-like chemotaxis protein
MLSKAEFAKQIRQALDNLFDFAYLQNLTLIRALSGSGQSLGLSVRQLRSELLDAIDQLKPGPDVPPLSKEQRPYALMYGRYIHGMSTSELVEELMIGVRQLRREHKRALEAVTDLMWDRLSDQLTLPAAESTQPSEAAEVEAGQLISQARAQRLDLLEIIRGVLTTLAPVASQHHLSLVERLPEAMPVVRADRVVLRQGILDLIYYAMSRSGTGQVIVEGRSTHQASLSVIARGEARSEIDADVDLEVSRQLIASLGGRVDIVDTPQRWQATIALPPAGDVPILVMDDNAGLIELFRRYLAGHRYRLVEAHTAEQAIQKARATPFQLIVLDIMMPQQDGWEVLQHLRAAPETREVPIVICSVLNQPEIAAALGAADYLPKPVTEEALLSKIEQWCGVPPQSAE